MSESRDEELARLIEEQRRDDSSLLAPERGVIHSFSATLEYGGTVAEEYGAPEHRDPEPCPLHGRREQRLRPNGTVDCRACDRERMLVRARARGVQPYDPETRTPDGKFKATGPRCGHDPSRFRETGGRITCRDCRNAASRAHYQRHIDRMRAKNRAYKRRRSDG